MKINIIERKKPRTAFRDVKNGNLFAIDDENELFVKMVDLTTPKANPFSYNAVSVRTGDLVFVLSDRPVKLVEKIGVMIKTEINFVEPKETRYTFMDIAYGDLFIFNDRVCVKVNNRDRVGMEIISNAVSITTGIPIYVSLTQIVKPVEKIDVKLEEV